MDFLLVVCAVYIIALAQSTKSEPRISQFQQIYPSKNYNNEVAYNFGYSINDDAYGVKTDRWEERRGNFVKGAYSLLEPGGQIRTVDYTVDGDGGFKAVVKTSRPGIYYLSTMQYLKSLQEHLQPSPELYLGPVYPDISRQNDAPPVNYHAINAEYIGYQRLFGVPFNRRRRSRRQ